MINFCGLKLHYVFLISTFFCVSDAVSEIDSDTFDASYRDFVEAQKRQRELVGAASKLDQLTYFIVRNNQEERVELQQQYTVSEPAWLVVVGPFEMLISQVSDITFMLVSSPENPDAFIWIDSAENSWTEVSIVSDREAYQIIEIPLGLRFSALWLPFEILAFMLHKLLMFLVSTGLHWGVAIGIFCLVVRTMLAPFIFLTVKYQAQVEQADKLLIPSIRRIKAAYHGEKKHQLIVAEYDRLNLTPFYRLKPAWGLAVLVPVWIVSGYMIAHVPELKGQSFLWINDLALPDQAIKFEVPMPMPMPMPGIGHGINMLPIFLLVVSLLAALNHSRSNEAEKKAVSQSMLLLVALLFFLFLYQFPSSVLYYCIVAVIIQILAGCLSGLLLR